MAPRPDLSGKRDAVAERRARVMELTQRGWKAYEIAYEMRLTVRTVQRYRDNERAGRPAGLPLASPTVQQLAVMPLIEQGLTIRAIVAKTGVCARTVSRCRARARAMAA